MTKLSLTSGGYEAVFLPQLGMLGASLRWRGTELLSLHGGLRAYREGHTTGMPLLAPWANRLSSLRYRAAGVEVDLRGVPLHAGEDGLPRHGTMGAQPGWRVVRLEPARVLGAFDSDTPELLAAFPFPHRIEIDARVSPRGLRLETAIVPLAAQPVPVAFGSHPYFEVPGPRASWRLRLPAREHLALDSHGVPTGASSRERGEDEPLRTRSFDDLYALGRDRRLALTGDDLAVEVHLGAAYPYAQVYAPGRKALRCARAYGGATDALVRGTAPSASRRPRRPSCRWRCFADRRACVGFASVLPGLVVIGFGAGLTTPLAAAVLSTVPVEKSGVASGVHGARMKRLPACAD